MSELDNMTSLGERAREAREASASLEGERTLADMARYARDASEAPAAERDTGSRAFRTASNSSCDTRCDTPDEEAARPAESRLRSAIRNALGTLAPRQAEGPAVPAGPAGTGETGAGLAEPGPDGGGPVPRLQEPIDVSGAAQATRTISLRLTEDDFRLVSERCAEHGLSRSDYIRQMVRADAVVGEAGMRRVLVLDRTSMLSIAKELRAWGRHYNQAVHALNIVARYLRGRGDADEAEIADALLSARAKLDDVENGRHRIEARLDELCCLDAIRGR